MGFQRLRNKITQLNVKKAIRFCKKNGLSSTYYAIRERMEHVAEAYEYHDISDDVYEQQQKAIFAWNPLISILVPAFETDPAHLQAMIDSVLSQSYQKFELIIADASKSCVVERVVEMYCDERIKFYKVIENKGISENTNVAISYATGEYCSLLDHDDILTKDALYEVVQAVNISYEQGIVPQLLYSDEDKTDQDAVTYFEPHNKLAFNLDLFLSNNYICHFTTMKSERLKSLQFRPAYDGAQDYDVFLRVVSQLLEETGETTAIVHIPKVLYHWRCHLNSTAANPESKLYAYEAGRSAVEDFLNRHNMLQSVSHTKNLGFYRVNYGDELFQEREDIAAVGSFFYRKNRVAGGAYGQDGTILYEGLARHYSGYMNRASLQQDVYALDLRTIHVRSEFRQAYEVILEQYGIEESLLADVEPSVVKQASIQFAKEMKQQGKLLLLDPLG